MQWFGESWEAPICHSIDHTDTPVDHQCIFCPRLIDEGDQGFLFPHFTGTGEIVVVAAHRDCLLRAIIPESFVRPSPPV